MQPELTQQQIDRHNSLYDEANVLTQGEMILDGQPALGSPGFFARRRLKKATGLFHQVLDINPTNWNAMLLLAKIHQRLGDLSGSLELMLRARELAPDNTSLAKEAAMTAAQIGDHAMAIQIGLEAISIAPSDPAIHSNLGLSYLLSNQPREAISSFSEAQRLEPRLPITRRLLSYAQLVESGQLPSPKSERDISRNIPKES